MRTIASAVLVVAALLVAGLYWTPAIQWDGSVVRQVRVFVQSGDGAPIAGGVVTFHDETYGFWMAQMARTNAAGHEAEAQMRDWLRQGLHYASGPTDAEGSLTFSGVFPAGGTRFLLWNSGGFRPEGVIRVQADGYCTVERSLPEFVGQSLLSLREYRRKPLVVRCFLERTVPGTPEPDVRADRSRLSPE